MVLVVVMGLIGAPVIAQTATLTTAANMRDVRVTRAGDSEDYSFHGGVQRLFAGDCVRVERSAGASAWLRFPEGATRRVRPGSSYCLEAAPRSTLVGRLASEARRAARAVVGLFTSVEEIDPSLVSLTDRGTGGSRAILMLPDDDVWTTVSDRPPIGWFYGSDRESGEYIVRLYRADETCRRVHGLVYDVRATGWVSGHPDDAPALERGSTYRVELWRRSEPSGMTDTACFRVSELGEYQALRDDVSSLLDALYWDESEEDDPGEDPGGAVYIASYIDSRGFTMNAVTYLHIEILNRAGGEESDAAVQTLQRILMLSGSRFSSPLNR